MPVFDALPTDQDQNSLYIIGQRMLEDQLRPLAQEIDTQLEGQLPIYYCDVDGPDGAMLVDRYGVEPGTLPAVLMIEDDEEIYASWYGPDVPNAETVAEEARQLIGLIG